MQLFVNGLEPNIFCMANIGLFFLIISSAILLISLHNPVYIALTLILTFFTMAICWVTLNAEFLAFMLIIIYVGAVMVLFLFIIMMLDLKNNYQHSLKSLIISLPIAIGLATIFVYITKDYNFLVTSNVTVDNVSLLGNTLFTNYLLPFCLSGLLLLAAIIAAICVSYSNKSNRHYQSVIQQMLVDKKYRLDMRDKL